MNSIQSLTIDECIPKGQDFQNWIFKIERVHDKIRPSIPTKRPVCNCINIGDPRGRCSIISGEFIYCPERASTAWFCFKCKWYYVDKLETYPLRYKSIIKEFLKEHKLYHDDIYNEICALYKVERKEELRIKRNEKAREKRKLKKEQKVLFYLKQL